ncbi:60S acidic ribosomal protein P1-1 [Linum perenne]
MILHDEGIPSDKISALVKASGVKCESYWPSLFAKLAEKRNVEDLILNAGAAGGGAAAAVAAPAGGAAPAAAAAPAAEEKKEEAKEESDEDMGFSLFD